MRCLEAYKKCGYKLYQMVEYSKNLLKDPEDISKLHSSVTKIIPNEKIPISMLYTLKLKKEQTGSENIVEKLGKKNIMKLFKSENIVSIFESLMELLKCSEDEFIRILIKNPRLITQTKKNDYIQKVNLLVNNGVDISEIKRNSHILNNQTYDVIEKRINLLKEINPDVPIFVGTLNRTEKIFEKIYKNLNNKETDELSKKSFSILSKLLKTKNSHYHLYKRKVDMMLKKSFTEEEIIEHVSLIGNLKISMQVINFSERIKPSKNPPSLKMILTANSDHLVGSNNLLFIEHLNTVIDCNTINRLPLKVDKNDITQNMKFLLENKFTEEQIIHMPFVLCYPTHHVKEALANMFSDPNVFFYEDENILKSKILLKSKHKFYFDTKSFAQNFPSDSKISVENESKSKPKKKNNKYIDEYKIRLLNVLQYKLEMVPMAEILRRKESNNHVKTEQVNEDESGDVEDIYDFKEEDKLIEAYHVEDKQNKKDGEGSSPEKLKNQVIIS